MSRDLDTLRSHLAEALQRRAHWHLTAQDWENYLRCISDLVTLYEHDNTTATNAAALMGAQGQDIMRWLDLAQYAHSNLVQAIDQAQSVVQKLTADEQREETHLRQLSTQLARRP